LILSDFSLPAFDGLTAIATARAGWPELPVILVSGTLGEELTVDSLKSGPTDYVLKDHLFRLAPAVRRAMQDVEERDERRIGRRHSLILIRGTTQRDRLRSLIVIVLDLCCCWAG